MCIRLIERGPSSSSPTLLAHTSLRSKPISYLTHVGFPHLHCLRLSGENFGKYLKVGVVEDEDIKEELAGLCRFFSKNHGEDFVSFDEYMKEMKVGERPS